MKEQAMGRGGGAAYKRMRAYRETDREIIERVAAEQRERASAEQRETAAFARYNQLAVWSFEAGVLPNDVYDH